MHLGGSTKLKGCLLFIQHLGYLKHFENTIRELSNQGTSVEIWYYKKKNSYCAATEERVRKLTNVSIHFKPDVIDKKNLKQLRFLRKKIDSMLYQNEMFSNCEELSRRILPPAPLKADLISDYIQAMDLKSQGQGSLTSRLLYTEELFYALISPSRKYSRFALLSGFDIILISPLLDGDLEPYLLIKLARLFDIPTVYLMASWDNLENKGLLSPKPDAYLVWSEYHRSRLRDLHQANDQDISIVGSEMFEKWHKLFKEPINHNNCSQQNGLKILYLCSSPFISSGVEHKLLEKLIGELIDLGNDKVELTVKLHPQTDSRAIKDYIKIKIKDNTFIKILASDEIIADSETTMNKFKELLTEHDICLGLNTSAMLEACMFGLPVFTIHPKFEGLNFPNTLHRTFLQQYMSGEITNLSEFGLVLNRWLEYRNTSKNLARKLESELIPANNLVSLTVVKKLNHLVATGRKVKSSDLDLHIKHQTEVERKDFIRRLSKATKILVSEGLVSLYFHTLLHLRHRRTQKNLLSPVPGPMKASKERNTLAPKYIHKKNTSVSIIKLGLDVATNNFANYSIKSENTYFEMLTTANYELKMLTEKYDNLVVGPWFSEFGFEVLYWIPFLNQLLSDEKHEKSKVISISRGGIGDLYEPFSKVHINALSVFNRVAWEQITSQVWKKLGGLKQSSIVEEELMALDKLLLGSEKSLGEKTLLLHPSLLFSMFRPYWRNKSFDPRVIVDFLSFPEYPKPTSDQNLVVKLYNRPSLVISDSKAKKLNELLMSFEYPIKVIAENCYKDDHQIYDGVFIESMDALKIEDFANNLRIQLELIKRSKRYIGTYGGLSYFPLYFGITSTGLYAEASKFDYQHLKLAQILAAKYGGKLELIQI